uniref:DNA adenine methylase n=1 Tax=uncultured marine virus TaxID=186617 RepID=A0A0F7L3X9_9VIRU|nr:DNA adenine methylase [uncultured marine virus]
MSSTPQKLRPKRTETSPVVPAPANGSSTTAPRGAPARMHGSMSFGGNVAKCAPLYGRVVTVQTLRLLRPLGLPGGPPE